MLTIYCRVLTCLLYREISCQTLLWQFCNFTCKIINYCWEFAPKLYYISLRHREIREKEGKTVQCSTVGRETTFGSSY